jgi:hypothetical protein
MRTYIYTLPISVKKEHCCQNPPLEWAQQANLLDQSGCRQGCQMVTFKSKNPNLGIFWWALEWKMLVNFKAFW